MKNLLQTTQKALQEDDFPAFIPVVAGTRFSDMEGCKAVLS